jgi:hypothetical protein
LIAISCISCVSKLYAQLKPLDTNAANRYLTSIPETQLLNVQAIHSNLEASGGPSGPPNVQTHSNG